MKARFYLFNISILLLFIFSISANICIAETLDTFNPSETGHTGATTDTLKPAGQSDTPPSETKPQKPNEAQPSSKQSDDTSKSDNKSKSNGTSESDDTSKTEAKPQKQAPQFSLAYNTDVQTVDAPATINWTLRIENTGNLPLSRINITAPLLNDLKGPEGDGKTPGVLDVSETWTYTGTYTVTQAVIDGNGVNTYNVIDGDGDIDSIVLVRFAETADPQTASAAVATNPDITGDIFEKKYRNIHAFFSAQRAFTSNLYKTDANPESCWSTTLTPGIWATYPSNMKRSVDIITANASPGGLAIDNFNPTDFRNFQVYALYSPQLEMYHDDNLSAYQETGITAGTIDENDSDRLSHRIDAMVHYYSGNKLTINAIDQYKISYDAFSVRTYWTDDKYTSNVFNIANTLDPTEKIQVRLDYSNFYLNYDEASDDEDNRKDNVYSAYLFFRQTSKLSYFLEYDYADIGYDSSDRDNHEDRYFGGVRWEITGKSSGQIKGGYGKKKSDESPMIDSDVDISDISEDNWMAAIQLDHKFDSRTSLTLNAYRRYDEVLEHRYDYNNSDGLFYADYTLAHFVGAKFSREVRHNIHLNLDSSVFFDDFKGSGYTNEIGEDEDREDREFAISPSVKVDMSKYFSVNGGYIYTDHVSNYPAVDYVDHTFFILASLFL